MDCRRRLGNFGPNHLKCLFCLIENNLCLCVFEHELKGSSHPVGNLCGWPRGELRLVLCKFFYLASHSTAAAALHLRQRICIFINIPGAYVIYTYLCIARWLPLYVCVFFHHFAFVNGRIWNK